AVALSTLSAPAFAQDTSDLGGVKIGAVVGYDIVRLEAEGEGGSRDGFIYGATVGYDVDLGRAIIGVEAEIADSTTEERLSDILSAGDEFSLVAGRDFYIGARAGIPIQPDVLLYAKGGYSNAKV